MPRRAWRFTRRAVHRRTAHLPPVAQALLWTVAAGVSFSLLNALVRALAQDIHPFQAQFLRYLFGLLVLAPLIWHHGFAAYRPRAIGGQFIRGGLHTAGLCLWFVALPQIPLADLTAIGFTTPLFIMVGAWLFFREPMLWERWLATVIGFVGVLIVVGPRLHFTGDGPGLYHLVMLASCPVFAASFLVTKALTRYETTGTILVWQGITITCFSLPLAWPVWQPIGAWLWAGFALSGLLGSLGHYCLTRGLREADISATQSPKFLELIWATALGWMVFGDLPSASTLAGGLLISAATLWVAQRESRIAAPARPAQ
jgi:drug/metabolite transporter (DMT)-like permease